MKNLIVSTLLISAMITSAQAVNFEIWNKTNQPLYFELGTEKFPPTGDYLAPLNAFGKKENIFKQIIKSKFTASVDLAMGGDYAQANIDPKLTDKVMILLAKGNSVISSKPGALITINPGKDIVIEVKEAATGQALFSGDYRKFLVSPQSEKTLGYSERDLRLRFNVTNNDLTILNEEQNRLANAKKLVAQELKSRGQ